MERPQSDIPLDLEDGSDRYLHTATEFMYRLIDQLCESYYSPTVTPYMLVLLLEALVPEAPGAAKRQAEAHLLQYGGGACGKKEVVELIKSVQAAGRISNADVMRNAVAEMHRREAQRPPPAWLVPRQSGTGAARAASTAAEEEARTSSSSLDPDTSTAAPNSTMGLYAPSLSLAYDLQQQLDAAQLESEAQARRIEELESTLRQQRPTFGLPEHHLLEGEMQPVSIVKKGITKGKRGFVKTGRGAVSFVDDEVAEAANAAARDSVVSTSPPPPTALSRASMPTRDEVVATARALVAQTRSGGISLTPTKMPMMMMPSNAVASSAELSSRTTSYPPPSQKNPTSMTYHYDPSVSSFFQPAPTTEPAGRSYYSSAAALGGGGSAGGPPGRMAANLPSAAAVSPWMLSVPSLTPYHSDTVLSSAVTHHSLLTATDVARILSDKRPLSVQREEAAKQEMGHSRFQQQQQAADGRGRLYGSSYALNLEKRSTMDNISLQRIYAVM